MHLRGALAMPASRSPRRRGLPAPGRDDNDARTYFDAGFQGGANWK